jgi:hypothetical protein
MVSLDTIEKEIAELEARGETTYAQCERLAWLYICRDHLLPTKEDARTRELHGSEFLEACSDKPYPALMKVLDEHIDAIRVIYPKEYEGLMARIKGL